VRVHRLFTSALIAAAALAVLPMTSRAKEASGPKPTVVLVHGAFADSSSWNGVVTRLLAKGYPVVAVANPLRSLKGDAGYLGKVLDGIPGPIVLVGHSYGGAVITYAKPEKARVKALVYVAGFAPDAGESAFELSTQFPGSTLGGALAPAIPLPGGGNDLYIVQERFHAQFAADVSERDARLMAATQRPVTEAALNESGGIPAWKSTPSWFVYGTADRNIPAAALAFMAKRASAKEVREVKGASHAVMVSHPAAIARVIEDAAASSRG
jgi:pimeloyl-ACP methyl ester carboxylesterase